MTDDLKRSVSCCKTMFQAFADEYEKAVLSRRQESWAKAVIATVEMLKMQDVANEIKEIVK